MEELEASLQQFGELILQGAVGHREARAVCVRWVRRVLTQPASDEPLADQVRRSATSWKRASEEMRGLRGYGRQATGQSTQRALPEARSLEPEADF